MNSSITTESVWLTVGMSLSTLGDQAGWIAVLWFVMSHTDSPARMGLVALCYSLPSVVVGMFAGMLFDRFPRLWLMVLDNVGQGILFVSIPLLQWIHLLPFWLLCVILICADTLSPFTAVGAMTLGPELLPAQLLSEGNAWDETLWQGASLAGPLLGGVLISSLDAPLAILADGLSFWLCALCLLRIHPPRSAATCTRRPAKVSSIGTDMLAGFQTLVSLPVVLVITVVALLLNLAYGQLDVSLPLLAHHELHVGGAALGAKWTANALGAMVSSAAMFIQPSTWIGITGVGILSISAAMLMVRPLRTMK